MANTKTQKKISIAKTKSELILEWFITVGAANITYRKVIQEKLNKGKSTIYRMVDKLKEIQVEDGSFDALAQVFTIAELNSIIDLFNEYQIAPPEFKETPEEKHEKELAKQSETVNKHLKDMGMKPVEHTTEDDAKEVSIEQGIDESETTLDLEQRFERFNK